MSTVTVNIPSQVLTYANLAAFPISGELLTIYIALNTNLQYRWTGSAYQLLSDGGSAVQTVTGDGVDNTDPLNPVLSFPTPAEIGAYTTTEVDNEISAAVVGLLDDRGNYDASSNTFPSTGGSGIAGAILKGDLWTISVGGTLGGNAVTIGDVVRALVDSPAQTSSNWAITENNIGYVPENNANKTDLMSGNTTSSIKFLSAKGVYDWVISLAYATTSYVTSSLATFKTDNYLDATSSIQNQLDNRSTLLAKNNIQVDHTGTTAETKVLSWDLTGKFQANDLLQFLIRPTQSGAGNKTIRIKVNNADSLTGAVTLATYTFTTTSGLMIRNMWFSNTLANIKSMANTTSFASDLATTFATVSTNTFDFTGTTWLIISVELADGANTQNIQSVGIIRTR